MQSILDLLETYEEATVEREHWHQAVKDREKLLVAAIQNCERVDHNTKYPRVLCDGAIICLHQKQDGSYVLHSVERPTVVR